MAKKEDVTYFTDEEKNSPAAQTIEGRIMLIQKSIRGLGKDTSGGQYRYVSGAKVLDAIRPRMDELGLSCPVEIVDVCNTRMDYLVKGGTLTKSEILSSVKMRFTWTWVNSKGEVFKDPHDWFANGMNDWEKGFGSALTYGERYFFLKQFHIPTDEDDVDNPQRKINSDGVELGEDYVMLNASADRRKTLDYGRILTDLPFADRFFAFLDRELAGAPDDRIDTYFVARYKGLEAEMRKKLIGLYRNYQAKATETIEPDGEYQNPETAIE